MGLQPSIRRAWVAESRREWAPSHGEGDTFPALSVGTSPTWAVDGEGVFVGLLPGTELPDTVPQHDEECADGSDPVQDPIGSLGPSVTVVFEGCRDDDLLVERVVQVDGGRLLWVQVRSADRPTANRVLDSLDVIGID